jgi:TldD protein
MASLKKSRVPQLPSDRLASGDITVPGYEQVLARPLQDKLEMATEAQQALRQASASIRSTSATYHEIVEDKAVVTTDGAAASWRLVRPEIRVSAVAEDGAEQAMAHDSLGATGTWECLFANRPLEQMVEQTARRSIDLLKARVPAGGPSSVILDPALTGLLAHEAIGHTVEADIALSGSVARDSIGQRVGSELVTLADSGHSEYADGAGGTIPVDDEGVRAGRTVLIESGVLRSWLHNRETAALSGVEPTGNARAWDYAVEPLIRMRNTYFVPGPHSLEEMIATTRRGFLLKGPRGGQADSTGEFMFGVQEAYPIEDGRVGPLLKGVTISGVAFELLRTVDMVSSDFRWDLGAGYCGKGQPMKVDAGGPHLRCRAMVGGSARESNNVA